MPRSQAWERKQKAKKEAVSALAALYAGVIEHKERCERVDCRMYRQHPESDVEEKGIGFGDRGEIE